MSSSPKNGSTRRRKVVKEDEDWKPDSPPEVVKKAATAKKAKNSPVVRGGPYNHRHHNPDIAHLGVPVEGSIRHLLLSQVALSTRIITWLHKARSPLVDFYFITMSFLGDQVLYVMLLPWFLWILDPPFGRQFLLLLVTGTIFGNGLKNFMAMPRPPSPPLWTHHKHEDFGMPSTHTSNAVSMSFFLTYWLWPAISPGLPRLFTVLFVTWYTSSMFISRMYLAAHSHVDTISGFLLGVGYWIFWLYVNPLVDLFINTNPYAPYITALSVFVLLLFHPRSSRPSPSFRYSMSLSGLGLGVTIGVHLSRFVGSAFWLDSVKALFSHDFRDSVLHSLPDEYHKFAASLLGVSIGIFILISTYVLVKYCALIVLLVLFRLPPVSWLVFKFKAFLRWCALPHPLALDNLDHPQWHEDRVFVNPKDAKMFSDMIGTISVGIVVTHFIPIILNKMGLILTSLLAK